MGDFFQTIVDRDASLEEAKTLSSDILNWLVRQGIVEEKATNCVLGNTRLGHSPGQRYQDVLEVVEFDDFDIHRLAHNGLEIVVEHTVFTPGQGNLDNICPKCSIKTACNDEWFRAVGEWYSSNGDGFVRCFRCGYTNLITEWSADPPWGFGNLGFVFWNWSPLKKSFIDQFTRRLEHRTVYLAGKL